MDTDEIIKGLLEDFGDPNITPKQMLENHRMRMKNKTLEPKNKKELKEGIQEDIEKSIFGALKSATIQLNPSIDSDLLPEEEIELRRLCSEIAEIGANYGHRKTREHLRLSGLDDDDKDKGDK